MEYTCILVSRPVDGVGVIQINRPAVLNALNLQTMTEIVTALGEFDADSTVRCIVLYGNEKAFAAGADFVMLGGMLAGHDEGGGEVITKHYKTNEVILHHSDHSVNHELEHVTESKKFVKFYGMSSDAANTKHFGGLKDYRASEGREVLVPYRGAVGNTIQTVLGGVRSTCTYVGASTLKQLSKCTTFIRVNNQYNRTYESSTTKM